MTPGLQNRAWKDPMRQGKEGDFDLLSLTASYLFGDLPTIRPLRARSPHRTIERP